MFFKKIIQAFSNKFVQKGVTYLPVLLQLLPCAQQLLAITIYSILPNFPRQTFAAVSGVKMGLLQKLVF